MHWNADEHDELFSMFDEHYNAVMAVIFQRQSSVRALRAPRSTDRGSFAANRRFEEMLWMRRPAPAPLQRDRTRLRASASPIVMSSPTSTMCSLAHAPESADAIPTQQKVFVCISDAVTVPSVPSMKHQQAVLAS